MGGVGEGVSQGQKWEGRGGEGEGLPVKNKDGNVL